MGKEDMVQEEGSGFEKHPTSLQARTPASGSRREASEEDGLDLSSSG